MEASLLSTKVLVPPVSPSLVPRPRLIGRLRAAFNFRLVLVSAPAGFGKTTLMSQWAAQNGESIHTSWVGLDEGDNDPVRFWDYFIAALKTLRPEIGETALSLLHSPQPYPIERVLTALINDLASCGHDFAVVLDDYHFIKAEPIHASVAFLLDHLPPMMRLIIGTRVDPPLPLAHFRGRGTMLEIGADDLRFTLEESAALLKEVQNVELTAEDVSSLNSRTEGWAVGLKMAALSISKRKDIPGFIASLTGSQRYVMDYLLEEVLKRQPDEIREFLFKTSVLEKLTAPLCDFVSGRSDSLEMLVRMEQANLFLIPLDESQQWYRYHHLFAELLRYQLELKSGLEEVTALHLRASEWYEGHGLLDDAVRHALLARDWQTAMRLIYAQSEARLSRGEFNTLLSWLQVIPADVLRTHLRLYSQYANVLISLGLAERAEAALSYLERTSEADPSLPGEVAFFRFLLARHRGDTPAVKETAKRALLSLPPDKLAYRGRVSLYLGEIEMNLANLEEARSLFTDAYETARQSANYWIWAYAAAYSGWILWLQGRLREALGMEQQAIDVAGQSPAAAVPR